MNPLLKAQFDILFGSLKDYHQGFVDGSFKATGFLLLVLGWLLTSKEARAYLAGSRRARRLAAVALCLGSTVYGLVTYRVYALSGTVFDSLVALQLLPTSAFITHQIRFSTVVIFIAQNAVLTLVACYFVLDIKPAPAAPGSPPAP